MRRFNFRGSKSLVSAVLVLASVAVVSCDWEDDESSETFHHNNSDQGQYDDSVECKETSFDYQREGGDSKTKVTYYCFEANNQKFVTTCADPEGCSEVDVNVHYMIPEDLGENYVVHIEAFDNYKFTGYPQSTTIMTNFSAKQGEWGDTKLILSDGQYYLRAYLSTGEESKIPIMLEGMELIAEKPIGVYGALSSPSAVRVSSDKFWSEPVTIYLDKLFKDPSKQPDTNAHVRVKLSLASGVEIEKAQKIYINLHASEDFEVNPVLKMTLLSDPLVDLETNGYVESVTDQLEPQKVMVFAYVDEDDNGYYDEGEPKATYENNGRAQFLDVDENATRTVMLVLDR